MKSRARLSTFALLMALPAAPLAAKPAKYHEPPVPLPHADVFDLQFARDLADYARQHRLTAELMQKIAPHPQRRTLTDSEHLSWTADLGACHSSMSADILADHTVSIAIVTPDDLTVSIDQDGGMRCSPVGCDSGRQREIAPYVWHSAHVECR